MGRAPEEKRLSTVLNKQAKRIGKSPKNMAMYNHVIAASEKVLKTAREEVVYRDSTRSKKKVMKIINL